jgi:hypothetical protein
MTGVVAELNPYKYNLLKQPNQYNQQINANKHKVVAYCGIFMEDKVNLTE